MHARRSSFGDVGAVLVGLAVVLCGTGASGGQAGEAPEKIALWAGQAPVGEGRDESADAFITVYRPPQANGTAVVICPGGGYGGLVTGAEGSGIARWLNGHGITGIVLEYRLPKGRPFVPLLDAQRAIRVARFHARTWGYAPDRIGIIGFSAGGHLASTAATHFDDGDPLSSDPVARIGCRPDFAILIYPVITMDVRTHSGSRTNLLGPNPGAELMKLFSNEQQVTARTCPTFLAHAKDDRAVSPDNSRMFYEALRRNGVAAQYLELPSGDHGLNGYKGPMWDAWQTESLRWLATVKMLGGVSNASQAAAEPAVLDTEFVAACDGTKQRYVMVLPAGFAEDRSYDVLIALHGHGSDRWQFVRDPRGECQASRDVARERGMIFVSPDYRAATSWMGPKAEADVVQIIGELRRRYRVGKVFLCGGSMGGTAALTFAALHPDLIAGVASMNGTANLLEYENFQDAIRESFGGSKAEVPQQYKDRSAEYWPERFTMPVAITVGGADTLVPPESVRRLASILQKIGRPVLIVDRQDGGHETTYADARKIIEYAIVVADKPAPAAPAGNEGVKRQDEPRAR